jgi:hypothetical protein
MNPMINSMANPTGKVVVTKAHKIMHVAHLHHHRHMSSRVLYTCQDGTEQESQGDHAGTKNTDQP